MAVIRLIILVTVLGGLTLLLAQNFSPALPLVFLGMRTKPFPLSMWILFSVFAGGTTSFLVSSLLGIANYFAPSRRQASKKTSVSPSSSTSYRQQEPSSRPASSSTSSRTTSDYRNDTEEDWDLDSRSDDWDFEETKPKSAARPQDTKVNNSRTQEYQEERTTSSKSDSSYSYSYREPQNSGVGKTESIYDADYRVIVPPYQQQQNQSPTPSTQVPEPETAKSNNEDDWSFFDEDDDFEDDRQDSSNKRRE
jgi:hypothetical protein